VKSSTPYNDSYWRDEQRVLEFLDWDSRHFGFGVARVTRNASEPQLREALDHARREGVQLVYAFRSEDSALGAPLLRTFGGRLICTQVRFSKAVAATTPDPNPLVAPIGTQGATDSLRKLAIEAGRFSRFHLDPRIPDAAFEALYIAWLENSVSGEIADVVLVARDETGLVTLAFRADGVAQIGLLSVAAGARRSGRASSLVAAAEAEAIPRGSDRLDVVTQVENVAACAFYRSAGFQARATDAVYHFWLDEDPT